MQSENTMILSKNISISLDITNETSMNNNLLVVGWLGYGKIYRFVNPNIEQMNTNYIVTDFYDALYDRHAENLRQNGYEVKKIEFGNPNAIDHYNPFHYIATDSFESMISDIHDIATIIFKNTIEEDKEKDLLFTKLEQMTLETIMLYACTKKKTESSFYDVSKLLKELQENHELFFTLLDEIEIEYPNNNFSSNYLKNVKVETYGKIEKTWDAIIISLAVRLRPFCIGLQEEDDTSVIFDTLHLDTFSDKKNALFISLRMDTNFFQPMIALFIHQISKILMQKQENKCTTRFILDNFGNLGYILGLDSFLSMAALHNVSYNIILQSFGILRYRYKESYNAIMDACDWCLTCGSVDVGSASEILNQFGNELKVSEMKRKYRLFGLLPKKKMERIEHVEFLNVDDMRLLDCNKCLIFRKGQRAIVDDKCDPE